MKDVNVTRYRENNRMIEMLEGPGIEKEIEVTDPMLGVITKQKILLKKDPENPPLGLKYLNDAPFKFGGKKRQNSNSGGQGRAGRRQKRHGKSGGGQTAKVSKH